MLALLGEKPPVSKAARNRFVAWNSALPTVSPAVVNEIHNARVPARKYTSDTRQMNRAVRTTFGRILSSRASPTYIPTEPPPEANSDRTSSTSPWPPRKCVMWRHKFTQSATWSRSAITERPVSYTHLRAHETDSYLVCRLLLEKKKK